MPDAFVNTDGPVAVDFEDGTPKLLLPRIQIKDYLPWLAEMQAERRKMVLDSLPKLVPIQQAPIGPNGPVAASNPGSLDRYRIMRDVEANAPQVPDLRSQMWTVAGVTRVIGMAMDKAKATPDQRQKMESARWPVQFMVAVQLSSLFAPDEIAEMFAPKPADNTSEPPKNADGGTAPQTSP